MPPALPTTDAHGHMPCNRTCSMESHATTLHAGKTRGKASHAIESHATLSNAAESRAMESRVIQSSTLDRVVTRVTATELLIISGRKPAFYYEEQLHVCIDDLTWKKRMQMRHE